MLEPVVEHVHGRAEARLGQASGPVAVAAHHHRHAVEALGEHARLVARRVDAGAHPFG